MTPTAWTSSELRTNTRGRGGGAGAGPAERERERWGLFCTNEDSSDARPRSDALQPARRRGRGPSGTTLRCHRAVNRCGLGFVSVLCTRAPRNPFVGSRAQTGAPLSAALLDGASVARPALLRGALLSPPPARPARRVTFFRPVRVAGARPGDPTLHLVLIDRRPKNKSN